MQVIRNYWQGIALCLVVAIPSWFLGHYFPVIGAPVFGILFGMFLGMVIKEKEIFRQGINFSSKKVLQYAVVLLGFGLNLNVVMETGKQSLPIILSTITIALVLASILSKLLKIPSKIACLVGVGSSICGGSAIAATSPVVKADDEEVAQAISVIFFFNVLAAIVFPSLGTMLGFNTSSGEAFGIFAGTAVNDTSSVTAAASTWDSIYHLGVQTLDKAVTIKLTRTLAIIPITLGLAYWEQKKEHSSTRNFKLSRVFPKFIIYFVLASLFTTLATQWGMSPSVFVPLRVLSKFLIVLAMVAIGLNTNIVKLFKTGGKPLLLGFLCWLGITLTTLGFQYMLGLW